MIGVYSICTISLIQYHKSHIVGDFTNRRNGQISWNFQIWDFHIFLMFSLWRIFVQNFRSRNSPVIKIIMNALSENAQKEPYPHFRALRTGEVECGSSVINWLPCSCYGNEVMKITFVYFEKWDTKILVFLLLLVDTQTQSVRLFWAANTIEKTSFNPFVSIWLPRVVSRPKAHTPTVLCLCCGTL